jgi:hypothetical protein
VERTDSCLNPNGVVDPLVLPQITSPATYYRAVDRYGPPAADARLSQGSDFERARANLLKPGCP